MTAVAVRRYPTVEGRVSIVEWLAQLRDDARDGELLILLLCGGDKRTQTKDIEKAHDYWKDYKARKPAVSRGGTFEEPD